MWAIWAVVASMLPSRSSTATAANECEPTFMGDQLGFQMISERISDTGPCRVSMNLVGGVCEGHSAECQAFLRNRQSQGAPSKFWTGFGPQRPVREPAALLRLPPSPKVAVCIAGAARTFDRPVVHASWGNFFGELAPPRDRMLFIYLKLDDAKVAADKQHTHDASISHSSIADLEPALQALRDAGETIAALKVDSTDRQHPTNPSCPLLATDGKTPYTTTPQHLLASLDSLEQCFALIEEYEVQHAMRFDVVAYQRPDLTWTRPLPLAIGQRDVKGGHSDVELRDEIVLSCPRPADPHAKAVLCDVAAVMPRRLADLYFKRRTAYYECTQPTIYCLAVAYDFGLPASFATHGAAVRFLDVPAVIVRSVGDSLWARNSCSARQNATGLSTEVCLAEIYERGLGGPSISPRGPWWPAVVHEVPESFAVRCARRVRTRDFGLWSAGVLMVLLICSCKRVRRVCRRQACKRRLGWTSVWVGSDDLVGPLGKV